MEKCKVCGNSELDVAGRCVSCQTQVAKPTEKGNPLKSVKR